MSATILAQHYNFTLSIVKKGLDYQSTYWSDEEVKIMEEKYYKARAELQRLSGKQIWIVHRGTWMDFIDVIGEDGKDKDQFSDCDDEFKWLMDTVKETGKHLFDEYSGDEYSGVTSSFYLVL